MLPPPRPRRDADLALEGAREGGCALVAGLLRVVKSGGRIGLANWTPDGFIGQLFQVVRAFGPPPSGLRSPLEWGTETRLVELFGPRASELRATRRTYMFRYRSAEHWIEVSVVGFRPRSPSAIVQPGMPLDWPSPSPCSRSARSRGAE